MGGPKPLMMVGGREWWRVQRERLRSAGVCDVWVVSPEFHAAIKEEGDAAPRMVIGDPAAPMFASVAAGVLAVCDDPLDGVFLLPVDVPAPAREVWSAIHGGVHPRVPRFGDQRGHPVWLPWAFVNRAILPRASGGDWVARTRLDHLIADELVEVEVDDPGVLANLNTREDVERWVVRTRPPEPPA